MKKILIIMIHNWRYLLGGIVGYLCALVGSAIWDMANEKVFTIRFTCFNNWQTFYSIMALIGIIVSLSIIVYFIVRTVVGSKLL